MCVCPGPGSPVPVKLGRGATTRRAGRALPWDLLARFGAPDRVCQQPQLANPQPEVCSCSASGQEFANPSFHLGWLNWAGVGV